MKVHPAAELFPLLAEAELRDLAIDIAEHGQRDPLVLLDGAILDGRNRAAACSLARVEPKIRTVTLAQIGSPTAYVISTNLKRRHLTPVQAACVAAEATPMFAEEAKARERAGGGDKRSAKAKAKAIGSVQSAPTRSDTGKAAAAAAKATKAGQRATATMIAVQKQAPEVFALAKAGKVSVADADRLARMPTAQRSRVVAAVSESPKPKSVVAEAARQGRVDKLADISRGDSPLTAPQRFPLLLADPPWRYEHVETESRAIENQYPTMTLDDICAMPVAKVTTADAILFLWATSPKLAEAMRVVEAWGFTYRTCAVWVKDKIGMGYYFRQRHELLLVATKGKPPTPAPADRLDSVIEGVRVEHSAKPVAAYEAIERMYPTLPRMEMFCRRSREGWHAWGNQA